MFYSTQNMFFIADTEIRDRESGIKSTHFFAILTTFTLYSKENATIRHYSKVVSNDDIMVGDTKNAPQ